VQGHVDGTAVCSANVERDGSNLFAFDLSDTTMLVQKGSVCINGVSLTVATLNDNSFSVAIIPFTFEHTNFRSLKIGDSVNIEYDVIGKYVQKLITAEGLYKR
jgi:riboflavin synthase